MSTAPRIPAECDAFRERGPARLERVHGEWRARVEPWISLAAPSPADPDRVFAIASHRDGDRRVVWHAVDVARGAVLARHDLGITVGTQVVDLDEAGERALVLDRGDLRLRTAEGAFVWRQRGWQSARFAPGGATVATVSSNGTIGEIDAATGELRARARGFALPVFSRDGGFMLQVPERGLYTLFERPAAREVARWRVPHAGVWPCVLDVAGARLFEATYDASGCALRGATLPGPRIRWTTALRPEERHVVALALTPDESRLLAFTNGGTIVELDAADGTLLARHAVPGFTGGRFARDGGRAALWCATEVATWDSTTGALSGRVVGHTAPIVELACSSDGADIASRAHDRTLRLWTRDADAARLVVPTDPGGPHDVFRVSPDDRTLWATTHFAARAWRLADGAPAALPCPLPPHTYDWRVSPDGRLLWVEVETVPAFRERRLIRLADGAVLWRGHAEGRAAFVDGGLVTLDWEIGTGRPRLCRLREADDFRPELIPLRLGAGRSLFLSGRARDVFSDDGAWLAVATDRGFAVHDAHDGREVACLEGHVQQVLFGGTRWLFALGRAAVEIRALPDLAPRGAITLDGAGDRPVAIAAAADGATLVVGTHRGVVLRFACRAE